MNVYARSALAGAATGARMASSLMVLSANPVSGDRLPPRLVAAPGPQLATVVAAAELVGDKLPKTPARTRPGSLLARVGVAAFCGHVLGRRAGAPVAATAGLAAATAGAWSFAGVRLRAAAAKSLGHDVPGALIEDVGAYAAAHLALYHR